MTVLLKAAATVTIHADELGAALMDDLDEIPFTLAAMAMRAKTRRTAEGHSLTDAIAQATTSCLCETDLQEVVAFLRALSGAIEAAS